MVWHHWWKMKKLRKEKEEENENKNGEVMRERDGERGV